MRKFVNRVAFMLLMAVGVNATDMRETTDMWVVLAEDGFCNDECLIKSWEQFKVIYKPYFEVCVTYPVDKKSPYYNREVCEGIWELNNYTDNWKLETFFSNATNGMRIRGSSESVGYAISKAEAAIQRQFALKSYDKAKKAEFRAKYPNAK